MNSVKKNLISVLSILNVSLSIHNDVICFLKTWTNAPTEPTCAANMQTARIPWAPTAVFVRRDTQAMASLAQVGLCWKQLCKWQSKKDVFHVFQTTNSFLKAGSVMDNF